MTPDTKPDIFTLVRGSGEGFTELNAFDQALLNAGIGDTNLMRMSSIIPPNTEKADHIHLPAGALVPVAYASITGNTPGVTLSAAIAVALPEDSSLPGVIMEHEAEAPLEEVKDTVYKMAEEAFRYRDRKIGTITTLGIEHTVERCGAAFAAAVLWYK